MPPRIPVNGPSENDPANKADRDFHYDINNIPKLICALPNSCPSEIGELVMINNGHSTFCTATLIGPDLILTASHCLSTSTAEPLKGRTTASPIKTRNSGTSSDLMGGCWVRFPEQNLPERSNESAVSLIKCSKIISASTIDPNDHKNLQADFAIIRLATSSNRPFLKINALNIGQNRTNTNLIYGTRLKPQAHELSFIFCVRNDNFDVSPLLSNRKHTIIFPSCGVESGFSGGPILDPMTRDINGVVSGVIGYDSEHPGLPRVSVGSRVFSL